MQRLLASCLVGVAVLSGPAAQAHEVYGQVGTEGLGIGYGYSFSTFGNVRAEFNGFSISHSFTSGGQRYDGKLNLAHAGLYLDFFPAPTVVPFRLTAGVLLGGDNIDATASSMSGTYTINGVPYSTNGETVRARADFPTARPYIGIGFGHTPTAKKGFSMFFDAGVAYGRPDVTLNVPADIVAEAGQANVDAEEQQLQHQADRLRFYPIVKIGVSYRF